MGLLSSLVDIGGGFLKAGKEKKAIAEARRLEEEQVGQNITGFEDLRQVLRGRTDPAISAGQSGTSELERLLIGGGRNEPTAAETFATERAQQGFARAQGANKQLLSGRNIEGLGEISAGIGNQFRQQGIQNLFGLSGQGLQATGMANAGDLNVESNLARQRELLGDIGASAVLGRTQAGNRALTGVQEGIGNMSDTVSGGGNLLKMFI